MIVCTLTGPDRRCLFHRFCVWSPEWSRFLCVCQTTPGGFLYCAGTLRPVIGCHWCCLYLSIFQGNITTRKKSKFQDDCEFLCPRHKMAKGHLVFALSVIPSFRHSVPSKFVFKFWQSYGPWHLEFLHILANVFATPPTSLRGFEWNLAGMLYHKSRSACGEIIYVRQILVELWSLTLRIFAHFSLSSQLLLHPCIDLNETWQGCCTTSLEVHFGRLFMFDKFWQSYSPWHLE